MRQNPIKCYKFQADTSNGITGEPSEPVGIPAVAMMPVRDCRSRLLCPPHQRVPNRRRCNRMPAPIRQDGRGRFVGTFQINSFKGYSASACFKAPVESDLSRVCFGFLSQ